MISCIFFLVILIFFWDEFPSIWRYIILIGFGHYKLSGNYLIRILNRGIIFWHKLSCCEICSGCNWDTYFFFLILLSLIFSRDTSCVGIKCFIFFIFINKNNRFVIEEFGLILYFRYIFWFFRLLILMNRRDHFFYICSSCIRWVFSFFNKFYCWSGNILLIFHRLNLLNIWFMILHIWFMLLHIWFMLLHIWFMLLHIWFMLLHIWFMIMFHLMPMSLNYFIIVMMYFGH